MMNINDHPNNNQRNSETSDADHAPRGYPYDMPWNKEFIKHDIFPKDYVRYEMGSGEGRCDPISKAALMYAGDHKWYETPTLEDIIKLSKEPCPDKIKNWHWCPNPPPKIPELRKRWYEKGDEYRSEEEKRDLRAKQIRQAKNLVALEKFCFGNGP